MVAYLATGNRWDALWRLSLDNMGASYLDGHGHPTGHHGNLFIDPAELAQAARPLGDLGFQLHFHTLARAVLQTPYAAV